MTTESCDCKKQNIVDMSFRQDREMWTNRMCLTCGEHWYGKGASVKRYTRKEWDDLMDSVE